MISIIILLVLIFGFFMGLKRGFILQLMHLVGFIIAFIVAILYFRKLASHLPYWIPYPEFSSDQVWAVFLNSMPLENAFYNAIAFAIIFFATKIILQIIASMLDFLANLPVLRQLNKLLGAILGFVEVYFITFLILFVLALLPMEAIQVRIKSSFLATLIVEHTPILSKAMEKLWFTDVLSILYN
ncbi:CvpA family protein [Pseudogracilibacillus sp. SO30301A]|uniref:CvpA family protein n=1 Tax=Pseudogracilibacillus sp. SO30301A TaxID=3098291 RepID=UPI00300DF323